MDEVGTHLYSKRSYCNKITISVINTGVGWTETGLTLRRLSKFRLQRRPIKFTYIGLFKPTNIHTLEKYPPLGSRVERCFILQIFRNELR